MVVKEKRKIDKWLKYNSREKGMYSNIYKVKVALLMVALLCESANFCIPQIQNYGYVTHRDTATVKNAEIQKVVLYSRKCKNCSEKLVRHGILLKKRNAKATVLICHGFTCNKYDTGFLRYLFKDYNCMNFDFRAHGENAEGQCCTLGKNEAYDVIAAAKFLRMHPDLKDIPLLVYGFSMGAVASIEAQAKDNSLFDAMILDCPFDSAESVVKRGLDDKKLSIFGYEFHIPGRRILQKYVFHPYVQSFVKAFLKAVANFNTKSINTFISPLKPSDSIKKISVPCFLIHCKNDEKISVDNIKNVYYNAHSDYKKLWITNGRKHYDSFFYNPEKYEHKVKKFTNKVISGIIFEKNKHKIIEDESDEYDVKTLLNTGGVVSIKK